MSLIYCFPSQRNAYMQNWQFSSICYLPYIKNLFVFVLNEWITTSTKDIVTKNSKKHPSLLICFRKESAQKICSSSEWPSPVNGCIISFVCGHKTSVLLLWFPRRSEPGAGSFKKLFCFGFFFVLFILVLQVGIDYNEYSW